MLAQMLVPVALNVWRLSISVTHHSKEPHSLTGYDANRDKAGPLRATRLCYVRGNGRAVKRNSTQVSKYSSRDGSAARGEKQVICYSDKCPLSAMELAKFGMKHAIEVTL